MSWVPVHHADYHFKNSLDPIDYLRHRIVNYNESYDVKIVSKDKGKGKSSVALAFCLRFDKNFKVSENVSFTSVDWIQISGKKGRGSAIMMDELGTRVFASSHRWQSDENQAMSDTIQVNRTDGQIFVATTLDEMRMTNRIRDTFPVYIYPERKIKVRRSVKNPETGKIETKTYLAIRCIMRIAREDIFFQNSGRDLLVYPRYTPGGVIKRIILYAPPEEIFKEYSEMRDKLKTGLREAFLQRQEARLALKEGQAKPANGGRSGNDAAAAKRVNGAIRQKVLQTKKNGSLKSPSVN